MEDAPGGGARFVAEFPAARMPAGAEERRMAEMAEAAR
jgi:hypothetical protein